jgi:hypothetical protein
MIRKALKLSMQVKQKLESLKRMFEMTSATVMMKINTTESKTTWQINAKIVCILSLCCPKACMREIKGSVNKLNLNYYFLPSPGLIPEALREKLSRILIFRM